MEPKQALAHISEDGQRTQTVAEHLDGTARRSASFAAAFGAEQDGYYTGTLHDIGKYSAAFQRRLHGGERVDHSTAGAQVAFRFPQHLPWPGTTVAYPMAARKRIPVRIALLWDA